MVRIHARQPLAREALTRFGPDPRFWPLGHFLDTFHIGFAWHEWSIPTDDVFAANDRLIAFPRSGCQQGFEIIVRLTGFQNGAVAVYDPIEREQIAGKPARK
jgi:hypothetical protein